MTWLTAGDVEAARGDVAGHQQRGLARSEALERGHARPLVEVAVQRGGVEAVVQEGAVQHRHLALAIAEDDGVLELVRVADQAAQGVALLVRLGARRDEALNDGRRRGGRAGDLDLDGIVQEGVGEALDLRRHGRREEQGLAREGHELHDALDVGMKPMSSMRSASSMTRSSTPVSRSLPRSSGRGDARAWR
jgi:hypothetical protein